MTAQDYEQLEKWELESADLKNDLVKGVLSYSSYFLYMVSWCAICILFWNGEVRKIWINNNFKE